MWAQSQGATTTNLILDDADERLAFVAQGFGEPRPAIWKATDRSIDHVDPAAPSIPAPPDCVESTALLAEVELEVVADHGVWIGEINGLEVARVGHTDEGECAVDIGVGAYDQFASAALSPSRDDRETLGAVAAMVRPHRVAGAEPHPIGRLVRSRWLRAQVVRDPSLLGLQSVDPVPLLFPRPGLVETQPAAAVGTTPDGKQVGVVCSTGIDLGVAETAAGIIARYEPESVLIAMPERDHHPRIVASLESLVVPAQMIAITGEWTD